MKILYRRYSGSVGVTDRERGIRGGWIEKRLALMARLKAHGHEILMASKPSQASKGCWEVVPAGSKADLLMIEWSMTNWVFVREDIAETARYIQRHKGPIVFLCDDPEMLGGCFDPRTISLFAQKTYRRWTLWLNTPYSTSHLSKHLRFPRDARVVDAPFASLLATNLKPRTQYLPKLIYSGRGTGGREARLVELSRSTPIQLFGRIKEWAKLTPTADAPPQVDRHKLYAQYTGCLALADRQHKMTGWRTGRAYHALRAGIPTLVESDHEVLAQSFSVFHTPQEVDHLRRTWQDPKVRQAAWKKQVTKNFNPSSFNGALESVDL